MIQRAGTALGTGLLLPLLLAQAAWVVGNAQRLPEAAGPRRGRSGEGPQLRLLILGDSSAAGVGVQHQSDALAGHLVRLLAMDHAVDWRLIARSGATTRHALSWMHEDPDLRFDVAVVALGVNDVKNGVPLTRWRAHLTALGHLLRERVGANGLVSFSAIPPLGQFPLLPRPLRTILGRRALAFDREMKDIAASTGHRILRPELELEPNLMATDGFHPGPVIYRHWAEAAAEQIRAHRMAQGGVPGQGPV